MNHADVKNHLADYLEGDLPLAMRAGVDAHLDDCAECARQVDEMERTIRLLRTLPDPETPPMIAANVMRRIRAGETQPGRFARLGRTLSSIFDPSFVLPASAVAVAALVVMVVQDPAFLSRFSVDNATVSANAVPALVNAQIGADIPAMDIPLARAFGSVPRSSPLAAEERVAAASEPTPTATRFLRNRIEVENTVPRAPARYEAQARVSRAAPSYRQRGAARQPQSFSGSDRRGLIAASNQGRAMRVAQSARTSATVSGSSGGEDPRDEWLARGLEDPTEFAHFLAGKNLAEQELWVSRLADRAETRGLLDDLVRALRASGDASAAILSDDFAAQVAPTDDEPDRGWDAPFER